MHRQHRQLSLVLAHNLAVGLLSGVALACIPVSRKVAQLIASSAAARSAPIPVLMSYYARGTATSTEKGTEKPAKHSAESRLLPYRVAALLVATQASGCKGLHVDVVD